MSYSNIQLAGNIVRDPEIKFLDDGTCAVQFSIAVQKKVGDEIRTSFFDCDIYGKKAENFASSVKKGDRVILFGELLQRTYEAKDGTKRSAVNINVFDVGTSTLWNPVTIQRQTHVD